MPTTPISRWVVDPGSEVHLSDPDAAATPAAPGGRKATEEATAPLHELLFGLQERLYAEGRRSLLVVLQGIDASGKDGTVSHVFRGLNPLGAKVAAFKEPSGEALGHDFLWRVHPHAPARGELAIFNRSHYEDVLVARVHELVPEAVWRARYGHVNAFEELLAESRTTVVKCFLHVSKDEQLRPRRARGRPHQAVEDPTFRLRRARALGGLPRRLRGDAAANLHRARPLVPDPGRPQVVPQLGRLEHPHRGPRWARSAVPGAAPRGGPRARVTRPSTAIGRPPLPARPGTVSSGRARDEESA